MSPESKSFVAQRARGEFGQEVLAHMSPERKCFVSWTSNEAEDGKGVRRRDRAKRQAGRTKAEVQPGVQTVQSDRQGEKDRGANRHANRERGSESVHECVRERERERRDRRPDVEGAQE